jgi:hypothetical protein
MKGFAPIFYRLDYGRDVVLRASPNNSIGVTDNELFLFLSQQPGIDEVNFHSPMSDRASE